MFPHRSPPKRKSSKVGGSNYTSLPPQTSIPISTGKLYNASTSKANLTSLPLVGKNSTCRNNSTLSLNSNCLTYDLLPSGHHQYKETSDQSHSHSHAHQYHGGGGSRSSSFSSGGSLKRGGKRHWGSKDRAGMSFLIVIAFFAVFGLIILTEIFMIDERSHAGMVALRHGSSMGRLGDSMPDYDNVKDDYDLLEDNLLSDNKLGYVQFRDNKIKIQDADIADTGRMAGVLLNSGVNGLSLGGVGAGIGGMAGVANVPIIPWGKILPTKIEVTLPQFPLGIQPTDGSWQIVNGTRFKFFVFSAYYDRRDGAKLVRIIGATKTRGPERVWCRFWYLPQRNLTAAAGKDSARRYTSVTVMARVKVIRENWNLKYSACFVLCPVRSPESDVPYYVSIVSRLRTPPGNLLQVRNTDWDTDFTSPLSINRSSYHTLASATSNLSHNSYPSMTPTSLPTSEQIPDKIAVCVKPFHFNYDQALYLMEYLEFYTLLGVSHFTFYNHTIGPHAACVLHHYERGDIPANLSSWDSEDFTGIKHDNRCVFFDTKFYLI